MFFLWFTIFAKSDQTGNSTFVSTISLIAYKVMSAGTSKSWLVSALILTLWSAAVSPYGFFINVEIEARAFLISSEGNGTKVSNIASLQALKWLSSAISMSSVGDLCSDPSLIVTFESVND